MRGRVKRKGFFTSTQPSSAVRVSRAPSCISCGLYANAITPKMEPHGENKRGILVVAEAPGATEDEQGVQLIGTAGQRLRDELHLLGIDLDKDCVKTNAVNCRPPNNRTPTAGEIDACRGRLLECIKTREPKVIIALGGAATDALYGHRWPKRTTDIMRWRGWSIPDQEHRAWVVPTVHPSYVNRVEDNRDGSGRAVATLFRSDLTQAIQLSSAPFPVRGTPDHERVRLLGSADAVSCLQRALDERPPLFSFDYETTGLKPYQEGHKIRSCAVMWEPNGPAYSFLVDDHTEVRRALAAVLKEPAIGKTAHSLQFETRWSKWILDAEVTNWAWDTKEAAHILDDRHKVSGLKFQAFVRLGVPYWASEVEGFLTAKYANDLNKVYSIPVEPLLRYGGLDALYQYELALLQADELGVSFW